VVSAAVAAAIAGPRAPTSTTTSRSESLEL
jgi:hypothetical protein